MINSSFIKKKDFIIQIGIFLILFIALFQSFSHVTSNEHDPGSQAAYEYWLKNNYQWGTQISQNVGPLGFINYPYIYTGFLDSEKFIINFFITIITALLAMLLAKQLPNTAIKVIFILNLVLFSSSTFIFNGSADTKIYILMLLVNYTLFLSRDSYIICALAILLAILSLAKGSLLFISFAIITTQIIYLCLNRSYMHALLFLLSYVISFLGIWLLCGQNFSNLPDFLRATISFSSAYNQAMHVYESLFITIICIAVLLCSIVALLFKHLKKFSELQLSGRMSRALLIATEGFIVFVVWKHGIVRGDSAHYPMFFKFLCCMAPLLFFIQPIYCASSPIKILMQMDKHLVTRVITRCVVVNILFLSSLIIIDNIQILENPNGYIKSLKGNLQKSIQNMQFPEEVRAIAGNDSVGFFGWYIAPMVYNGLNYTPAPSTISFAGWNKWIMEKDAEFYRSDDKAPAYIIYTLDTIDSRLVAQDNSPAQLEILKRYDPVWSKDLCPEAINYKLLKRRKSLSDLGFELLNEPQNHPIETWINVPDIMPDPVRVKIHMPERLPAKIISMLYKPPAYEIEYKLADGRSGAYKFIPFMAEQGFLVSPLITNGSEFMAAVSQQEYSNYIESKSSILSRVTKFRITCTNLLFACGDKMSISFEKVHGLELGRLQ